jgi:1,2-dihydroxy-3-keto-5-methylthiopentene dioxygenase
MALLRIPGENRLIEDPAEISAFLANHGVVYERWPIDGRLGPNPTSEEILAAYAPEVEALKARGGFVTADVIDVTTDLPGLQAMLDKFNKEHTHAEDEIRFVVRGHGIFHIHPPQGPVFGIEVAPGDLIIVPSGAPHWFDLCADRNIRAIRMFMEKAGWTPHYTGSDIASQFAPLCFGPAFMPPKTDAMSVHPALA